MVVSNLKEICKNLGCRMSLKFSFFAIPFGFFRDNLGDVNDERYQGRWDENMMGDYIWSLFWKDSTTRKRKIRSNVHF